MSHASDRDPRRMRVLQLGKYYHPYSGGIETHLRLLCNELKRSVDLDVLVSNSSATSSVETIDGVRVTRCPQLANVASTSICPTMPIEIARRQYDVIHFHFPHPMGVMSYLLGGGMRRHAVVVSYHADVVRQARLLKMYRPFMNLVLSRADAIVCASPDYLESSPLLDGYRHKAQVIPYGIDLARFDEAHSPATLERAAAEVRARYAPGSGKERPIVLGVGRLVPYKGFEYLVRAMRDVDATLLVVGTGPLKASLERLAQELGVADRVHLLGEIDGAALRACYEACDLFVLSSIDRSEAFALVQLEAMAARKPVVNTAIVGSGVGWVSRDGESGLAVPPGDADGLARAMQLILADRALADRFGRAGRVRVERDFSKETMAGRTLALYRSLTERKSPGTKAGVRAEPYSDFAPIDS